MKRLLRTFFPTALACGLFTVSVPSAASSDDRGWFGSDLKPMMVVIAPEKPALEGPALNPDHFVQTREEVRGELRAEMVRALNARRPLVQDDGDPPAGEPVREFIELPDGGRIEVRGNVRVIVEDGEIRLLRREEIGVNAQGGQDDESDASVIPQRAQLEAVELPAPLIALVSRLGEADYETRRQATEELRSRDFAINELLAVFVQLSPGPEQRQRLLSVIQDQLINAPRGAVGISMQQRDREDGEGIEVIVTDLIEGLPAERILEIGDRITHLDGRILESMNDLPTLVQTKRPGERVELTVLRLKRDAAGRMVMDERGQRVHEELEVTIELGSAELLRDPVVGRPAQQSEVQRQRGRQMRAIEQQFAPETKRVEIRGPSGE